jgi:hypothetical protein
VDGRGKDDVLTRMRGRVSDRADRYQADYHAMAAIKTIADDYSVPFLVPHHTRNADAEDFLETVSGSHGLAGAADAVSVLKQSRGSADAVLNITGRDVEEAQDALKFSPESGTWTLLEGPANDYEVGDTRRQILGVVREHDGITPKGIAEKLDLRDDTIRQTVRRMADDGQLDTDGERALLRAPSDTSPDLGSHTSDDVSNLDTRMGHE